MLIDIHTHHLPTNDYAQVIMGLDGIGLHPWELKSDRELSFYQEKFLKLKSHSHPLIIGECGLDRRRSGLLDIKDQISIFTAHLKWASENNTPVVIHSVASDSDIIHVLKDTQYGGKLLWHDFRGNEQTLSSLKNYDCYFSFGASLYKNERDRAFVLEKMSGDQIFVETDDQDQFSLSELYQKLAQIMGLDLNVLEVQLEQNFNRFFSNFDNVSASDFIKNKRASTP